MPRKPIPPNSDFPCHVTARCHNGAKFPLAIEECWAIFEDYLFLSADVFGLCIHSFVLMPNHFHLLVSTPRANLSQAMRYLLTEFSRESGRLSDSRNQVFGSRHFKTIICEHHYFMNAYKYVYRNPVKAGICRQAEEYPYSTLSGLCGQKRLRIPLVSDTLLFTPHFDQGTLNWINRTPNADDDSEVQRALQNRIFEFKPMRNKQRPSSLQSRLY